MCQGAAGVPDLTLYSVRLGSVSLHGPGHGRDGQRQHWPPGLRVGQHDPRPLTAGRRLEPSDAPEDCGVAADVVGEPVDVVRTHRVRPGLTAGTGLTDHELTPTVVAGHHAHDRVQQLTGTVRAGAVLTVRVDVP